MKVKTTIRTTSIITTTIIIGRPVIEKVLL
jgi:hypothetical protein